ncbi:MAG: SPASM domain-containing protein [Candidatus Aminicenantes bacterium]|nr:SPASM domain-containing protein [Candidatus Aminicenantes bacterium]
MPEWVSFQNSRRCNLRCPHCQTHGTVEINKESNSKKYDMKPELMSRWAADVLPFAFEYSLSLSGEPLAFKGIENIVNEFSSFGSKLSLATNGTLFSPIMIENILPYLASVVFSIDGATQQTFEKLRLGAKFKEVIRNIKILKRTIELLSIEDKFPLRISFTIMGSNIHELPGIVRLAYFLGIPVIEGGFVYIFYDNIKHEDVTFHKSRYNYYYSKARTIAEKLGIYLNVPPPFNDAGYDPNLDPSFDKFIFGEIPGDDIGPIFYENYVSLKEVEKTAAALARKIRENISKIKPRSLDESTKKIGKRLQESYRCLLDKKKAILSEFNERINDEIKYCVFLSERIFIDFNGDVAPCCIVDRPVLGNIYQNSLFEVWNGEKYNEFRERFYSSDPYPCCKNCIYAKYVKLSSFFSIKHTLRDNF